MLLAIDVGNTNIVLGVFRRRRRWCTAGGCTTLRERTSDELGILVTGLFEHHEVTRDERHRHRHGSVVPPLTGTMHGDGRATTSAASPLNVEPAVNTGMPILYENPAEVGADRIVNGDRRVRDIRHASGRVPMIVVDFGTATTFDAISAKGEYLGGVICPGIADLRRRAVSARRAAAARRRAQAAAVIGRTTVGAMQSGLFYGYVDMVEGSCAACARARRRRASCVATGGLADDHRAGDEASIEHVDPD